jgi:hypothetical protein
LNVDVSAELGGYFADTGGTKVVPPTNPQKTRLSASEEPHLTLDPCHGWKKPEQEELMRTLTTRFTKNMHRHSGIAWFDVLARLEGNPIALRSLREMDSSGGEPDVIGRDKPSGAYTFCDCSPESPAGRRSVCYRELQQLGEFDTKTSSWIATPADVRKLGGALFCDRRYGKVFVYHNGAQSYYAARGFRGKLRV